MQNDLNMYQLDYEPERLDDFNDYFLQYIKTNKIEYYNAFLHFYEPMLNNKAKEFIAKYHLEDFRLADLKQMFSSLLWDELQKYNSNIPLLQIVKRKINVVWLEYVRTNCGVINIQNKNQFRTMQKVAAIFFEQQNTKPYKELIEYIFNTLKLTTVTVEEYIKAAQVFKYSNSLTFDSDDDSDDSNEEIIKAPDSATPESAYISKESFNKYRRIFETLSPIERRIFELTSGICTNCFGTKKKIHLHPNCTPNRYDHKCC